LTLDFLGESAVDNELVYALAHTGELSALEDFLTTPNIAKLEHIGDRLFDKGKNRFSFEIPLRLTYIPRHV
jgi:hypothetical protein